MKNEETANEILARFRTELDALVNKVHEHPSATITGFVYVDEPPFLLHFGNIDVAGMDLVYLHSALAKLCAAVQAQGGATVVGTNPQNGQKENHPTEIADELVQFLSLTHNLNNPVHTERIKELIEKYVQTRKKEKQ